MVYFKDISIYIITYLYYICEWGLCHSIQKYPHVNSQVVLQPKGQLQNPFGSSHLTAIVRSKQKAMPKLWTGHHRPTREQPVPIPSRSTYRRKSPIHRLSAVGLLRSLRAGSRGPYRWLNRIAAITHFLSLDMPLHQLPARSQILHRVSTLVEAMPQNWERAYPDDLWLLLEGDKFRQCKQLKIGTAHLEREDHLHDNCRLRWLQGLRQRLRRRIRLHRFRTLLHQGQDLISKWTPHQVVATSSLPIKAN